MDGERVRDRRDFDMCALSRNLPTYWQSPLGELLSNWKITEIICVIFPLMNVMICTCAIVHCSKDHYVISIGAPNWQAPRDIAKLHGRRMGQAMMLVMRDRGAKGFGFVP
jgi:hypothetical protein